MSNNHVVIMAGGVGSRFWPGSRNHRPKQFLDMMGVGKSLIRLTFERFQHLCPDSNIWVVTHADYKELVQSELPELLPEQILCEPSRKNTAPCVAYAAFKIKQKNPKANFVVAPADHIILKEINFVERIRQGLSFVETTPALLTLGIQPTNPNTGYGYIHFDKENTIEEGIYKVKQFTEKPNQEKAEAFLAGGTHLWNAGIFIWNVETLLAGFEKHAPTIFNAFASEADNLHEKEETSCINRIYESVESISIDYALMERADNIYTLPADIGWSDIGTWASLHEVLPHDSNGNSIIAKGKDFVLQNTQDCLVSTNPNKLTIIRGLEDYIVVDEADVLLIYPKNKEQEIKELNKEVESLFGNKYS